MIALFLVPIKIIKIEKIIDSCYFSDFDKYWTGEEGKWNDRFHEAGDWGVLRAHSRYVIELQGVPVVVNFEKEDRDVGIVSK